jgi:hypothetical protein
MSIGARQDHFGSDPIAMDFNVRRYLALNGLKGKDPRAKDWFLKQSFHYFALYALNSIKSPLAKKFEFEKVPKDILTLMKMTPATAKEPVYTSFTFGLAAVDVTYSSNAMRYLARHGQVVATPRSKYEAFEAIISVHVARVKTVLDVKTEHYILTVVGMATSGHHERRRYQLWLHMLHGGRTFQEWEGGR